MAATKYIGYGTITTFTALLLWFSLSSHFELQVSGDIVCKGTIDDPCISYFNITLLDLPVYYLYNKDGVKLEFFPGVKDYFICKPDGRYKLEGKPCPPGWREIDFASPYYYKYSYVYKFYKGKKEQFMLVGYKENPSETVKWGINAITEYIDPTWGGVEVNFFLDGVNTTRIYEFGSRVNISATSNPSSEICVGIDAPDYGSNFTCADGNVSFIYNITTLRQSNFNSSNTTRIDINLTEPCYQEFANVSTPCGGNGSGYYFLEGTMADPENAIDGDWNTYASATTDGIMHSKYAKPSFSTGAVIRLKNGDNLEHNITIPEICWNANSTHLEVSGETRSGPNFGAYNCYNSSRDLIKLDGPHSSYAIYEEGIFWNNLYYFNVTVIMDNRTDMVLTQFNITSLGTSSYISISYGEIKSFVGNLKGTSLELDEFISDGASKKSDNLSYSTGGSNYIYVNITANPFNLSFNLWGFDLDKGNALDFYDYFNETDDTLNNFNETIKTNYPIGFIDNYELNRTGELTLVTSNCLNRWDNDSTDGNWHLECNGGGARSGSFSSDSMDARNHSIVEFNTTISCSCSCQPGPSCIGGSYLRITDGTSNVNIYSCSKSCDGSSSSSSLSGLISLERPDHSTNDWSVYDDGVFYQTISTAGLDNTKEWNYIIGADSSGPVGGTGSGILYYLKASGIFLNTTSSLAEYADNGTFTSDIIHSTTDEIIAATIDFENYNPTGTLVEYYLSVDDINYEQVFSGVRHVFLNDGNNLSYRVHLNTTNISNTPYVSKIRIQVIPSAITNISVDVGDDDSSDWNWTGNLNLTTSPLNVSFNETYLNIEYTTIKISSDSAGLIQVNNFLLNSTINPIVLNETYFEDCSTCEITLFETGDIMNVSDLRFDFLGSWNYTAYVHYLTNTDTLNLQVKYSDFNLTYPPGYDYYDIIGTQNSSNITPYGQTEYIPIWNATRLAYDDNIDIYVKANETPASCINITLSNNSYTNSSKDLHLFDPANAYTIFLNTSYQKIAHNVSDSEGIWAWENWVDCGYGLNWTYFNFASICTSCVYDEDDLDFFNILVE